MQKENAPVVDEVESDHEDDVEDDEDDGEGDQDGDVHLARLILLHWGRYLSKRVDLHLEIGLTGFNMFLGITYNR